MSGDGIRKVPLKSGGVRYVVTAYDPARGGGSREVGRGKTLAEARAIKRAFEEGKGRQRAALVTCDEWADRWLVECSSGRDWGDTTLVLYKQGVRSFKRDFAGVMLSDIDRPVAQMWAHGGTAGPELERFVKQWQGAERLRSGQWRVLAHKADARVVRTMFTDAMLKGLVDFNPWVGLRLEGGRSKRKDAKMLSAAELNELVETARRAHPGYPYFAAMTMVAAYTGMRPGELYALQWEDIDFSAEEIVVRHQLRGKTRDLALPKNKQIRTVVLPEPAARELLRLPTREGTVFVTKRGKSFSGRVHHFYWDPVRTAFGRPEMEFYELRHFCGSYLADLGASPQQIALQLGHTDNGALAMRTYIHTYEDSTRDALRKLFRSGEDRDREVEAS